MSLVEKIFPRNIASPVYVFLGFLALYVLTRSHNLSLTHDSVGYLWDIEFTQLEFHPNHLLYTHLVWLLSQPLQWFFAPDAAIYFVHALAGALAMAMTYGLMRGRLSFNAVPALLLTLLAGLSYGIWYYSVSVEIYIFPLALLLTALYVLLSDQYDFSKIALVALLHSFAALFHQASILFAPVVMFAIFTYAGWSTSRRVRAAMLYVAVCALFVGAPYLYAAGELGKLSSLQDFLLWLQGDNPLDPGIQAIGLRSFGEAFVGFARALIGLNFLFAHDYLGQLILAAFPGNSLRDEVFLVREFGPALSNMLVFASLVLALGLFTLALLAIRQVFRSSIDHSRPKLLLLAWLIPYTSFFLLFNPSNVDFWMTQLVIILLLIGVASQAQLFVRAGFIRLLGVCAFLMLFVNGLGVIIPAKDHRNDLYRTVVLDYENLVEEGEILILADTWPIKWHLHYHTDLEFLSLSDFYASEDNSAESVSESLRAKLQSVSSSVSPAQRVVFSNDVLQPAIATIQQYGEGYPAFLRDVVAHFCPVEMVDPVDRRRLLISEC